MGTGAMPEHEGQAPQEDALQEEVPHKKSARRVVRRILFFLGGCLLLFVVLDIDWSGRGGAPPTALIDYDGHQWRVTRPEFFRDRGLDIKDVPPEENAALDYAIAIESLPRFSRTAVGRETDRRRDYALAYCWSDDGAVLWSYLDAAGPALARAHIGAGKARAVPPYLLEGDMLVNMSLPHLAPSRALCRWLVCEGRLAEAEGRPQDAADAYLDGVALGNHLAQEPLTISNLVGMALDDYGLGALDALTLHDCPEDVLRRALGRLRALEPGRPDFGHVLDGEEAFGLDLVRSYGKLGEDWNMAWRDAAGPVFGRSRTVRRITLGRTRRLYARIRTWDALTGRARWLAAPGLQAAIDAALRDWFTRLQASRAGGVFGLAQHFAISDLRWAATEVRIGLALYKSEHGRYPATLDEIKPYLGDIPLDPYVEEPFQYRLDGDDYVFYSVGPDLKDNGGVDSREDTTRLYSRGTNGWSWNTQADLVFTSRLAPPPPLDEYLENDAGRPSGGWSTEQ